MAPFVGWVELACGLLIVLGLCMLLGSIFLGSPDPARGHSIGGCSEGTDLHCMACHVAEGMPFLNDTPIFRDTAAFSSASAVSR